MLSLEVDKKKELFNKSNIQEVRNQSNHKLIIIKNVFLKVKMNFH